MFVLDKEFCQMKKLEKEMDHYPRCFKCFRKIIEDAKERIKQGRDSISIKSFISKKLHVSHDFHELPDRVVIYGKFFSKTPCNFYLIQLKNSSTCYMIDDTFR